jgi:hypothetical protein
MTCSTASPRSPTHDTAVADGTVGTVLAVALRAGCVNPAQGRMTS